MTAEPRDGLVVWNEAATLVEKADEGRLLSRVPNRRRAASAWTW